MQKSIKPEMIMNSMKYGVAFLTALLWTSCSPGEESGASAIDNQTQRTETTTSGQAVGNSPTLEIIDIDLKTLMDVFASAEDHFRANKKYVGKILRVTGRTNGVSEEGALRMQVKPTDEALWCYGLPDTFLLSVKEEDIVQITGSFARENTESMFATCKLVECSAFHVLPK
jgi:hypothetical protein